MARIAENLCECYKGLGSWKIKKIEYKSFIWQISPLHLELVDIDLDQQVKHQKVQPSRQTQIKICTKTQS